MSRPISGCTFGWLHLTSLDEAFSALASRGFRSLELTTAPPHLHTPGLGPVDRRALARRLATHALEVVSVNPSYADLNLVSTNPDLQRVAETQLRAEIDLAGELGARYVVVIPGRRHALSPAPFGDCREILRDALAGLAARAAAAGVTVCLENSPYGFLGTPQEQVVLVAEIGSRGLGIAFDVANTGETDPAAGIRFLGSALTLLHVSDTDPEPWRHTAIGRGSVDFAAVARALDEIGFDGDTVYELADGELPDGHLSADLAVLAEWGWAPDAPRRAA